MLVIDEAEVFDSDFESTDEEAAQEDEAAGEKQIVEEEKQTKRVCYEGLRFLLCLLTVPRCYANVSPALKVGNVKQDLKTHVVLASEKSEDGSHWELQLTWNLEMSLYQD